MIVLKPLPLAKGEVFISRYLKKFTLYLDICLNYITFANDFEKSIAIVDGTSA